MPLDTTRPEIQSLLTRGQHAGFLTEGALRGAFGAELDAEGVLDAWRDLLREHAISLVMEAELAESRRILMTLEPRYPSTQTRRSVRTEDTPSATEEDLRGAVLSRARIREIEAKALRKLREQRRPTRSRNLKSFIEDIPQSSPEED